MARLDTFQQEFNLTTNELDQLQRQLNIVKLEDFLQADALDIANCTELGAQVRGTISS